MLYRSSSFLAMVGLILFTSESNAQERIFSVGYTKNYISADSTNVSLILDINRVPGSSEKPGSIFLINRPIKKTSRFGWYVKPSLDINIGTGTKTLPNNISIGVPIGIAYDVKGEPLAFYLEGSPDLVADKTLNNYLFYGSLGPYVKFEYNVEKFLFNIQAGINCAIGKRAYADKFTTANSYGRVTYPAYIRLSFWNDSAIVNRITKEKKQYKKINITLTAKHTNVFEDDRRITPDQTVSYLNTKFDFYFHPKVGVNITYNDGYDEPLFQRVRSLTLGFTVARF